MKKLLLVALLFILLSCKKEKDCYHCTFGAYNGTTPPPKDYCGEPNRIFYDDQGNELSSHCLKKD